MSGKHDLTREHASRMMAGRSVEAMMAQLAPDTAGLPALPPGGSKVSAARARALWEMVNGPAAARAVLLDATGDELEGYAANIENGIGLLKLPVGLAGPLRVNGTAAKGDYPIPLATTEAALVASYHRGCRALTLAGGCSAVLLYETLTRSPGFVFASAAEGARFVVWAVERFERFAEVVASVTAHGRLVDMGATVEGNHVYLSLEFTTGDAAGQNMVTLASQAVCEEIIATCPQPPAAWFVESNLSGDKKASARAFGSARGRKVTAEANLPPDLVRRHFHCEPVQMVDYWRMSAIGGVLSGTLGVQGHFANGLAALYLATGQDAACVAESATGVTRFELRADGGLYAAVTVPGIMVGTVGGGTGLPTQRACLELMGLAGAGHAAALAEVCAGLLL
ncbi:MAG: hypothetical protein MUF04_13620, partial [Akkermansiaceae bacterium]|nr:hypothetical protein [Akkermansiaceae bacterium]